MKDVDQIKPETLFETSSDSEAEEALLDEEPFTSLDSEAEEVIELPGKVAAQKIVKTAKQAEKAAKKKAAKSAKKAAQKETKNLAKQGSLITEKKVEIPKSAVPLPAWSSISLSPASLSSLSRLGFTNPTPIQKTALPLILDGSDLIGKAPTGSGKTLAFGIPILEAVLKVEPDSPAHIMAVIIEPTRELAKQVALHLTALCEGYGVYVVAATGGLFVEKQTRLLAKKPHIVVATPGRLWDIVESEEGKAIDLMQSLQEAKFFVLDEADRLLQEGYFNQLKLLTEVMGATSRRDRQILVFSATFTKELQVKLSKGTQIRRMAYTKDNPLEYIITSLNFHNEPHFVDVNPNNLISKQVHEALIECDVKKKDLHLYYFLTVFGGRTLIFSNSIHGVRRLVPILKYLDYPALGLHGEMMQKQRMKAIEDFKNTQNAVLVATDIAARGLDISSIQHVIHYHLPRTADMYVHRSGRTGRSDKEGFSLVLCSPAETKQFRTLLSTLGRQATLAKMIASIAVDEKILNQMASRVEIAEQLVENSMAKNKGQYDATWVKTQSEKIGRVMDAEEQADFIQKRGPEKPSAKKINSDAMIAELRRNLARPFMSGFSPRYLTSGPINFAERLLNGQTHNKIIGAEQVTAIQHTTKRRAK